MQIFFDIVKCTCLSNKVRRKVKNVKRTFALVMAMLLLLVTACAQNAPLLTDALKQEYASFEAKGTFTFDTNLPVEDQQIKSLLQVLKSGVITQLQVKDDQHAHLTMTLQDPSPIMGSDIWPSKTNPGLDFYVNGRESYVKSTADAMFLGSKDEEDAARAQDELNILLRKLMIHFLTQNTFTFKHMQTIGKETIELPDGSKQQTTHIRTAINLQEMVEFATYAAEFVNHSEEFATMLKDFFTMLTPEAPVDENTVKEALNELVTEWKTVQVDELRNQGWDAQLVVDNWINDQKYFVQSDASLTVTAPAGFLTEEDMVPPTGLTSVTFTLKTHEQYWNHNQTVTFPYPSTDQIVMLDELEENPELAEQFGEEGLIGQIAALMNQEGEAEPPFSDVPVEHWAFGPISILKDMGIVKGYANNEFKPNKPITRSEFVVMAVNAFGLEQKTSKLSFTDKKHVPAWANESWQTAIHAGLVKGYSDGTLRPNQNISRAEMITILVRGTKLPLEHGHPLTYSDAKQIPAWAVPYVKTATAQGIVQGSPDNRFYPHKHATRAEVAQVLLPIAFDAFENEQAE
jgi:hypothetical protein